MADVAHLLQTLRPLREPPPPASVLPYLATVAIGVVAAVLVLMLLRYAGRRQRALRTRAEAALAASRRLRPPDRLAAQAHLLRVLVRALRGEAEARLDGTAWLGALDRTFRTTFFTKGAGRAFGDALYRPPTDAVAEDLDASLRRLIRRGRFAGPAAATARRA